jgi:hypothetical protein
MYLSAISNRLSSKGLDKVFVDISIFRLNFIHPLGLTAVNPQG